MSSNGRLDWSLLPHCIAEIESARQLAEKEGRLHDLNVFTRTGEFLNYQFKHKQQQQKYHKKANKVRQLAAQKIQEMLSEQELAEIDARAELELDDNE